MASLNMRKIKAFLRCIEILEKELKKEHDFKRKDELQKAIDCYNNKIKIEVNTLATGGF